MTVDDLGFGDIGYHGIEPDVRTPHLDKMAKEGVILRNMFVPPMCMPSRGSFLTGRYPWSFGMTRAKDNRPLPKDIPTIAEYFYEQGYTTSMIGKWHVSSKNLRSKVSNTFFGFNHSYYFEWGTHINNPMFSNKKRAGVATEFLDPHLRKTATQFIRDLRESNPLFMWLSLKSPHVPYYVTSKHAERMNHVLEPKKKMYLAMMASVDDEVAMLSNVLEEIGRIKNTLIVFFSDNGGLHIPSSNNGRYRSGKMTSYDGGVRVAGFMYWPNRLPAGLFLPSVTLPDLYYTLSSLSGHQSINKADYSRNFWHSLYDPKNYYPVEEKGISSMQPIGEPQVFNESRAIVLDMSSYIGSIRKGEFKIVVSSQDCHTVPYVTPEEFEKMPFPSFNPWDFSTLYFNRAVMDSNHTISFYNTVQDPYEKQNILKNSVLSHYERSSFEELYRLFLEEQQLLRKFYLRDSEQLRSQRLENVFCFDHMISENNLTVGPYLGMKHLVVDRVDSSYCLPKVRSIVLEGPVIYEEFSLSYTAGQEKTKQKKEKQKKVQNFFSCFLVFFFLVPTEV